MSFAADYVDVDKLPGRMAKAADAKKKYIADVKIEWAAKVISVSRRSRE